MNEGSSATTSHTLTRASARRRLAVLLLLAVVPWSVLVSNDVTLVLPVGLVNTDPWTLVRVDEFLRFTGGQVSRAIEFWLIGAFLYAVAVGLAALGTVWREDPRLTGGLVVLAGVVQFPLVVTWSIQPGRWGLPFGSVLLLAAAWWYYLPAARAYGLPLAGGE